MKNSFKLLITLIICVFIFNIDFVVNASAKDNFTCNYGAKKGGSTLTIEFKDDVYNITYPDGRTKKIKKDRLNNNSFPTKKCEDVYYSASERIIKTIYSEDTTNEAALNRYNEKYSDLAQFCDLNNGCIDQRAGGSHYKVTETYGECPKELKPILSFLKKIVKNLLQLVVPIILIIMGSIDLTKAIIQADVAGRDHDLKITVGKFVKRIFAAILMFFVTTIVNVVIGRIASTGANPNANNWKSCWMGIK